MAQSSNIEWTESTWNPVTGCTKTSLGCLHCYAERMARRLQAMGNPNYARGFDVVVHHHWLDVPLRWKKPRRVFVNSMSDLFHEDVPTDFILNVFDVMRRAECHTFQVLTKRSERLAQLSASLDWPGNVWMGVSVETERYAHRIDQLRRTAAKTKFVSFEPLLGPISCVDLGGLDWVIVGGESGPGARPMQPEWVIDVRDRCSCQAIPFFFKQWGGVFRSRSGRSLDGRTWDDMPASVMSAEPVSVP